MNCSTYNTSITCEEHVLCTWKESCVDNVDGTPIIVFSLIAIILMCKWMHQFCSSSIDDLSRKNIVLFLMSVILFFIMLFVVVKYSFYYVIDKNRILEGYIFVFIGLVTELYYYIKSENDREIELQQPFDQYDYQELKNSSPVFKPVQIDKPKSEPLIYDKL